MLFAVDVAWFVLQFVRVCVVCGIVVCSILLDCIVLYRLASYCLVVYCILCICVIYCIDLVLYCNVCG